MSKIHKQCSKRLVLTSTPSFNPDLSGQPLSYRLYTAPTFDTCIPYLAHWVAVHARLDTAPMFDTYIPSSAHWVVVLACLDVPRLFSRLYSLLP